MSTLEDFLADRPPGVYSGPFPAAADDVRREVETAGRRFVHLDTGAAEDKVGFLDQAAGAFGFPGWFGRNWDAFADSLGDVRSHSGTVLLWEGWEPFAHANEQQFAVALEILRERAESTLGGSFTVLMREAREDEQTPAEPAD